MSFLSEFWAFLQHRKKFWLAPLLVILGIFAGLLLVAEGSAIAPFLYTLF
ncbi:MAG: DUF5989 family protein [Alphaproteobacteria bacterium]